MFYNLAWPDYLLVLKIFKSAKIISAVFFYIFSFSISFISYYIAGQLEYTINELDKSVPAKLKENLQNITRRMDRISNNTDFTSLVFRSKDYEYGVFFTLNLISV